MNFFESQERAHKHTTLLIVLFGVAVIALIVMANVLTLVVFGFVNSQQMRDGQTFFAQMDWKMFATVGAGVSVVVLVGSLYKMMTLSAGGKVVAESLGGQLIPRNTEEPNQRKLLNVVDEMAIASGTPAPPVYLLANEPGINAFAAGFSPRDAVLGITQGAIEQLSRDQLQGVIAHEFSHIFNGDMRLNMRLMGALNGILILGILGYYLMYSASFSGRRRGNDNSGAAIMALAVGLMVIGFAGTFFGGLIKAAVSRQREYLADASAVQFTRNAMGIAGALKRIGALKSGSIVRNPGAPEVSHAFFAQGVTGFTQWLSSTHPPLASRILRIDPQWDGKFDASPPPPPAESQPPVDDASATRRPDMARNMATIAAGAAAADAIAVMDRIGQPTQESVLYARSLLSDLPAAIQDAAREPYGARAVIYCLLLDKATGPREQQLALLQSRADKDVYALTISLMPQMDALEKRFRLPIIDIAIPALKQLSDGQFPTFKENLVALINMDARVDLFEWSLQKILFRHLEGHFHKTPLTSVRHEDPGQLKREFGLVLSVIAHAGATDKSSAQSAFEASAQALDAKGLALLAKDQIRIADLDQALGKLDQLAPAAKSRLLTACVISTWHDQRATPAEVELLRAFASVLDCPMPPGVASGGRRAA
ncbi:MAG: M48 family metallopeptidase [Gammaproteobacteria bacterium]|nr:M48 family metallopeptidase [Gammaproteobacteria bacterium]MBU0786569.1 M48 family metallopeptidase [Gammaproteobacteria bacterium]MBU0817177.1 M48 family metallopeptidase [Gammaproteobacteria bacterium]MBU1787702.1 M48 family metallopeptidase [Gammaproteobacteria bacterium]